MSAFIELRQHRGVSPSYLNTAAIVSVSSWESELGEGAALTTAAGTTFHTDTPVPAVLTMIERCTGRKATAIAPNRAKSRADADPG